MIFVIKFRQRALISIMLCKKRGHRHTPSSFSVRVELCVAVSVAVCVLHGTETYAFKFHTLADSIISVIRLEVFRVNQIYMISFKCVFVRVIEGYLHELLPPTPFFSPAHLRAIGGVGERWGKYRRHHARRCNMLLHCNTLQHTTPRWGIRKGIMQDAATYYYTATHCNTLHRVGEFAKASCMTLQHITTLQHTATHCNTLHRVGEVSKASCMTLQHTTTHCITLQHTLHHVGESLKNIMQDKADSLEVPLLHHPLTPQTHCNTLQRTTHYNTLHHVGGSLEGISRCLCCIM